MIESDKHGMSPGLRYRPSEVDWGTARLIAEPSSVLARAFLYLTTLVLIGFGVYAAVARVAVVVEAPGFVVPKQGVAPVVSSVSLSVRELLIANNERVEEGQVLLRSQEYLPVEEVQRLEGDRDQIRAVLARDRALDCRECPAELEALALGAFEIAGQSQLRDRLAQLRTALNDYVDLRRAYAGRGASTADVRRRVKIAKEKLAEIRRRKAEDLLRVEVERLEGEIVGAKASLADRRRVDRGSIDGARNRLEVQLAEILPAIERSQSEQEIRAPVAGTVTELAVTGPTQILSAGQKLLSIVPDGVTLAVELRVANQDVARVRPDMPVRIKLAAYPEREYGTVTGRILTVAPSASLEPQGPYGGAAQQVQPRATYQVMVELSEQGLVKDGKTHAFRIGMVLSGLIVVKHETMLALAARRLLQIKDEIATED